MKKATFTFKKSGNLFKCVKVTNSTKYLPGTYFSEDEIKAIVERAFATEEVILTS